MAEFKLDRFKYTWKGVWSPGTEYLRDDIVRVSGRSYVCILGHTAAQTFADDLNHILPGSSPPQPQPYWIVMTASKSFLGNWLTSTKYNLGDVVKFGGSLYECVNDHVSSTFEANVDKWTFFARHIDFEENWTESREYGEGAIVKYNGILYKCNKVHTSQTQLEDDADAWDIFYDGIQFRSTYESGQLYRPNDRIIYGGSIFKCLETHISSDLLDDTKFIVDLPGSQYNGDWSDQIAYNTGDIVRYGGWLYAALFNNLDEQPGRNTDDSSRPWTVVAKTNRFVGNWELNEVYKTGDVVLRGGQLWSAKQDVNASDGDGSTVDYLNTDVWEQLTAGIKYAGSWRFGTELQPVNYSVGDVVYYKGTAYECNLDHQAENFNYPGENGSGYTYWDTLIQAGQPGALNFKGDILSYGFNRTVENDFSSVGEVNVPIGNVGEELSVSSELEVFWRKRLVDSDVIYVAKHGEDKEGNGLNPETPFRTVRHACEYVYDNFQPLELTKVQVATGRYEEIGPITIPAGCVVMGDELRSTSIVASSPNLEYDDAFKYVDTYSTRLKQIFPQLILLQSVTPYATLVNPLVQDKTGPISSNASVGDINQLIDDYNAQITFNIASGEAPTMTGSNNASGSDSNKNAGDILERNKHFIVRELIDYAKFQFPTDNIIEKNLETDIIHFLRALKKDLYYPGNYQTLLSADRWSNAKNGSQLVDIFRVRDTTGLRQCTTDGLVGNLNPPGVYDLYQRPTGGACVALDPGWGPDDESCWIKNRSPYIQGVTNIGTRCVGKKIDGALHNGGNRSMVSNDFTQVLSDGIGAWVTNNARAELVSVFTYYCQVGYLAENGGVVRATNGNNSYGDFGSIADGNDINEIPDTGTVNNRVNEAQVTSAFAGGLTDQIFVFEYTNTGEEYTTATANIKGSGSDALFDFTDFRDGGISRLRLVNTKGSGSEGGSGYLTRQGFAQITSDSSSSIILSNTDVTQFEEEILGQRIIIIAGKGVGQYGYIAAYDNNTRVTTIRKDSDGELGWDHVLPGYPIESSFDTTCQYRIEPRIIATPPVDSYVSYNLLNPREFHDVAYGGTREQFFALSGDLGTGDLDDSLVPVAAKFDILRANTEYTVTLAAGGAGRGYAVGDQITIEGINLGGATGVNDIVITVTEVTDDSSSSIVDFTFTGEGRRGLYVFVADSDVVGYSDDGENWNELNLSFVGDYRRIISGHDRFVAIAYNDNRVGFSYKPDSWVTRSLPSTENWIDGVYGNGKFVLICDNSGRTAVSDDGLSWTAGDIPDNNTGDSSTVQWDQITYGNGLFVATSRNFLDSAYSSDGITWTRVENALGGIDAGNIVALAYGNNRFLTVADRGKTAYSFDAITWYQGADIDMSALVFEPSVTPDPTWMFTDLKYNQGVFVAVGRNPLDQASNYFVTTEDGLIWNVKSAPSAAPYNRLAVSNIDNKPTFLLLASNTTSVAVNRVYTGAKAKLRAEVEIGSFKSIKIIDPGSNYSVNDPVNITITDNSAITLVEYTTRYGNGVIAQPDFVHRGTGYRTSTSTITITGDGFADIIPEGNIVTIDGVDTVPGPGVQIKFSGILDDVSEDPDDLKLFNGVKIVDLGDDGSGNGTNRVQFTLSPSIKNEYNLEHSTAVSLRSRYSQLRISGHDFLDIGTGNFEETNYPQLYAGGAYFTSAPENEVVEINGGRVFYVSTDQDGNFRAGELFSVQQATGIVTISAEFFDLDGLSALALGGVRLGGSGTVVNEFSTDPTFSADSNQVIPTQRAIATFLANRLSVGGENLETFNLIAGTVSLGKIEDVIEITNGGYLRFPRVVSIDGVDENGNPVGVSGTFISQQMFLRNTSKE